jgi:hypothetical protein
MREGQMKNEDKDILDILGVINKFFGSEYSFQIKSIEPKEYLEYKVNHYYDHQFLENGLSFLYSFEP